MNGCTIIISDILYVV